MHLLTWHGTVLCRPDAHGAITHQALPLDVESPAPMLFEAAELTPRANLRHPELGLMAIEASETPGALTLSRDGRYMCAEPGQGQLVFDREQAGVWEAYLPIEAEGLADLQHILRHRWIVRATRQVIRSQAVRISEGFVLEIGTHSVALQDLAPAIARRGPAGRPARLALPDEAGGIELVIAEPRSSALIDTEIWPHRARRIAEVATLAAHRHLTGQEPEQEALERDTRFLLARNGVAGLSDLMERLDTRDRQAPPPPETTPDAAPAASLGAATGRDDVLRAWALREMAPWLLKRVHPERAQDVFESFNQTKSWAYIYDFADGRVSMRHKPDSFGPRAMEKQRAQLYLDVFKSATHFLPEDFSATLCVGMDDTLGNDYSVPLFCFQKIASANTILLPDVDILPGTIFTDPQVLDTIPYDKKIPAAVFAGSTTGATNTPEVARNLASPRLRAAHFFDGHQSVDFRLPRITQYTSDEAADILRGYAFCQRPALSWQQQMQNRFILSMDGNGATCSRVAIALHSNSVLLKYNSPHLLYYFGGLQPWLHYVPIAEDSEVERVIALEARHPDFFRQIAVNGRSFVQTYLCGDATIRYIAMLLKLYGETFGHDAAPPKLAPEIGRSAPSAEVSTVVAHIGNRGDTKFALDQWVGEPGSQTVLEGFAISLSDALPAEGFTYQAVLEDGTLSWPAGNGGYCGTRGQNRPIFGLCITTEGPFAEAHDVVYEAVFVDGSIGGPVNAGTICAAERAIPLQAFRVSIKARADADARGQAADAPAEA